jgi:O-antigen ligase
VGRSRLTFSRRQAATFAAVGEAKATPLTGTGAGTFEFWWAQFGTLSGGLGRDAHSLYLQALGELGYPRLLLIAGFGAFALGSGVRSAPKRNAMISRSRSDNRKRANEFGVKPEVA